MWIHCHMQHKRPLLLYKEWMSTFTKNNHADLSCSHCCQANIFKVYNNAYSCILMLEQCYVNMHGNHIQVHVQIHYGAVDHHAWLDDFKYWHARLPATGIQSSVPCPLVAPLKFQKAQDWHITADDHHHDMNTCLIMAKRASMSVW